MATSPKISQYIAAVHARRMSYSFRLIQARLTSNKAPSALGWDPLREKYKTVSSEEKSHYEKVWSDLYRDCVLYGRRAVSIYRAPPDLVHKIAKICDDLINKESPYITKFPFPLDGEDLKEQRHNGHFVTLKRMKDGSVRLIACAKRSYAEREPINLDFLDDQSKEGFEDFDEVIGVRHGVAQAFDVIYIRPSLGEVEVHIDMPCRMTYEDIKNARKYYIGLIKKALPKEVVRESLDSPKNIFPMVRVFYGDSTGIINGLSHATGTSSLKEEKMRNKRQDLRSELFHKSGIDAVKTTDPYAIRIGWNVATGRNIPTIIVPGNSHLIGNAAAFVGHAILENCSGGRDYKFLMGKLS